MQAITQEYEESADVDLDEAPNEGIEVDGEERPDTDETETRARAQGWRPKEEYRGDPDRWVDANEFNRRGEEELPILRERNKRLSDQVAESTRRDAERDAEVTRMRKMNEIALVRQREQIMSQFHQAKRQAVELGDQEQFDQITQQEYQELNRFDQDVNQVSQPAPQQAQPNVYEAPETQDFISRNPWFETNREMHNMAVNVSQAIGNANPDWSLGEVLKHTESRMQKMYPDKFGSQSGSHRPTAAAVEGSGAGRGAATRQSGRGSASLPPDVRKQGQSFVDEGLFKNLEEYAKEYFATE